MHIVRRIPAPVAGVLLALAVATLPAFAQSPSPPASCPPALPMASMAPAGSGEQPDLTVFAAASLTNVMGDLQVPWQTAHPGSELILSLDASSALRAQIEQGAPADILASADTRNVQLLVDGCLARGPITAFAGNALVVVVPSDNPASISSPADLARPGVRYVAAGPEVPITRYAVEAIENLAALPGYPADFVAAVAANTVSEEGNVRAVLAKVELGEADAAIAYLTDAWSSDGVTSVPIPAEANVPATYAAVAVGATSQPGLAADFLEFLTGPDAQAVLASYGFLPPPEDW
jgi:molybdate transport system substrate-binding protein